MLKSELIMIQENNQKLATSISAENQKIIKDLMKSMSIFRVNTYEHQVIHRDLLGMAKEAELRNDNFTSVIGSDFKTFSEEILSSTTGSSLMEIFIKFMLKLSGYFFLWFSGLALGAYGRLTWEANPNIYIVFIGIVVIAFVIENLLLPLFCLETGIKKHIPSIATLLVFAGLLSLSYILMDPEYVKPVNGGAIIGISGFVYFLLRMCDFQHLKQLSKESTLWKS